MSILVSVGLVKDSTVNVAVCEPYKVPLAGADLVQLDVCAGKFQALLPKKGGGE